MNIARRLDQSPGWQQKLPPSPSDEFLRHLRNYGVTFTKHEVMAAYRQYGLGKGAA